MTIRHIPTPALCSALRRCSHLPRVVAITGEAGSGKTSVIRALGGGDGIVIQADVFASFADLRSAVRRAARERTVFVEAFSIDDLHQADIDYDWHLHCSSQSANRRSIATRVSKDATARDSSIGRPSRS